MKMAGWKMLMLVPLVFGAGCGQVTTELQAEADPERLRAHVEFLASDLFKGRDTGSPEYELAARYVAAEFQKLGLKTPDIKKQGDAGSYLQSVPLVESTLVPKSATASISFGHKTIVLKYPDEFTAGPGMSAGEEAVTADAVFVGYGIVAPNRDHDDYAGLDVAGKIVVLLVGRPESWPSEEGAHYASGRQKVRFAAERGAVGMVVIHTPRDEKTWPFRDEFKYLSVPRMKFIGPDGQPDGIWPNLRRAIYVDSEPARLLFTGSGQSLTEIFEADLNAGNVTGFPLEASVTMGVQSNNRKLESSNVIAFLEGSDPVLKDEYLVYTAHLDHIGVIETEGESDNIYNGAMDNAVGIALLLETARILSAEQDKLARSIAFVAVTGEEKGLLGAGYFVENPPMDISRIVANINLDMPILLYSFADVVAFGAEHSSLQGSVERALGNLGVTLSPDPMPEEASFVRSDHYRFVLKGVPSIMLAVGHQSQTPGEDANALLLGFLKDYYHEPNDDTNLPIDYEAGRVFAEINVAIGREISTNRKRPAWNQGDFFGGLSAN
jgi:hypothetical protein